MSCIDVYGSLCDRLVDDISWRQILLVGAGVALVATVGQWAFAIGVGLGTQPVGFAVVAAGVVAGRQARWGSAGALLLTGLLTAGWSVGVAWAVAAFVAAATSSWLCVPVAGEREGGWIPWLVQYVLVAVGGVLVFAATASVLLDLFGWASFSLTVGRVVVINLPLALIGVPIARLAVERIGLLGEWFPEGSTSERAVTTTRVAVVLVALVWTVSGYVSSFLFRVMELSFQGSLGREFSPTIGRFIAIWGWQGTYAQLLLGVVSLMIIGVLLRK